MNTFLDLDVIKRHLNINFDYHDEDEYLLMLADVAFRAIENHIDDSLEKFVYDGQLDPPLVHAALLLIGTYYQNRESVTFGTAMPIPHAYEYLLTPYINYESRVLHRKCDCTA